VTGDGGKCRVNLALRVRAGHAAGRSGLDMAQRRHPARPGRRVGRSQRGHPALGHVLGTGSRSRHRPHQVGLLCGVRPGRPVRHEQRRQDRAAVELTERQERVPSRRSAKSATPPSGSSWFTCKQAQPRPGGASTSTSRTHRGGREGQEIVVLLVTMAPDSSRPGATTPHSGKVLACTKQT
jgi:hypothetical protein